MRFTLLFKLCNVQKKLHQIRGRETNQSYAGNPPVYTPNLRTLECKSVITAALWRFSLRANAPCLLRAVVVSYSSQLNIIRDLSTPTGHKYLDIYQRCHISERVRCVEPD